MRASGITGKLSVSHLNQLCLSIQDREAWLAQPKVREMVAEDRVAKLSLMISNEQKSVDLTPLGGGRPRTPSCYTRGPTATNTPNGWESRVSQPSTRFVRSTCHGRRRREM